MSAGPFIILLGNNLTYWPRAEVARSVAVAAGKLGYRCVCLDWCGDAEREETYLLSILTNPPAGVIFLCAFETMNLALCQKITHVLPTVQALVPHPDIRADSVSIDNFAAASMAVNHLIGLGYRRIGHITFDLDWPTVTLRQEAYLNALRESSLPTSDEWLLRLPSRMYGQDPIYRRASLRAYLLNTNRPTAVFTYNDTLGRELVEVTWEVGVSVPDDLAIVGFGDTPHALIGVPLTTVSKEFRRQGFLSTERLIARINGIAKGAPRHQDLSTRLIIRESTRGATSSSDRWDRVNRYVQENFAQSLTARQVASVASLESHYFSREFARIFGKTFTEYVRQLRLEAARELLETSDRTIEDIAFECGFRNSNNFYRLFKQTHVVTPVQYRRQHSFR